MSVAFVQTFFASSREDGWIGEAFMTYYTATKPHQEVVGEEDLLIQSIHHFSDKPIVVANYGARCTCACPPPV